jgi:phosphoserine phosphatase
MERERWAIFDLDNTIANINERLKASTDTITGKLNYNLLHDKELIRLHDKPIKGTIELIKNLSDFGVKILILTARADETRAVTIDWLSKNNVKYDNLIMKSFKDTYVKSFHWKEKQMHNFMNKYNITYEQIILSSDDYGRNQTMFESWGIPCLDPNVLYTN